VRLIQGAEAPCSLRRTDNGKSNGQYGDSGFARMTIKNDNGKSKSKDKGKGGDFGRERVEG
jgi:hypothetical protein